MKITETRAFCGIIIAGCVLVIAFALTGCSGSKSSHGDEYLVKIDGNIVTVLDFQIAFETAKSAYPHDLASGSPAYRDVKRQLLNQMIEELIIIQRANELNLKVTDQELAAAAGKIKKDYPEGEFEQMLLEYAISYELWEKGLRTRLLMEKVITEDLKNNIAVTSDDLSQYYKENKKEGSGDSANRPDVETAVKNLRNAKAETAYKSWISGLQQKYKIEINKKQWDKITS